MSFRSMFVLLAAVAAGVVEIDVPCRQILPTGAQQVFGAEPAAGTLKVKVIDEAGKPLPARVHLRDAEGRYLLAPGHETRQRAVHEKTGPMCGDWFYTDGEFSMEVGAGEAQIDIAHGPEYAGIHETIAIATGQTAEKTYTLRRLIDLVALGWYNGDEHLHQPPDSAMMRAECLNIVGTPVCNGAKVRYSVDQTVAQLPDAMHLSVTNIPATEWDCFYWNLPKPLALRLGDADWPNPDGTKPDGTQDRKFPGKLFLARESFLVQQMHAAGATTIGYMHNPTRVGYYPLFIANGWVDVYGVLENGYCGIANRGTEAEFWKGLDFNGTNGNFGLWYRFLNCGYRLPASAGSDNVAMGLGLYKGYNRVFAKLEGQFTLDNWLAALRKGRSFVSNRPLLFVTIDGKEPGSELATKSGTELSVDIRAVSATPISRIDIMHQGRILKQIDIETPATDIRRSEKITLPKSGWLAVRCFGLGQNMNLGPKFAFAHTSPFYAIVDGQAIRSPEDARFFHEKFSDYVKVTVPFVENEAVRHALEAMCRDALAKWASQAEFR